VFSRTFRLNNLRTVSLCLLPSSPGMAVTKTSQVRPVIGGRPRAAFDPQYCVSPALPWNHEIIKSSRDVCELRCVVSACLFNFRDVRHGQSDASDSPFSVDGQCVSRVVAASRQCKTNCCLTASSPALAQHIWCPKTCAQRTILNLDEFPAPLSDDMQTCTARTISHCVSQSHSINQFSLSLNRSSPLERGVFQGRQKPSVFRNNSAC
jgi:hypothetical protein